MVQVGDQVIAHKTNNGLVAVTQGNQPVEGDKILLSVCMNGSLMTHGVSSVEIGDKVLAIPVGNSPDAVKGGRWGGANGFWAVKGGSGGIYVDILNTIWFPYRTHEWSEPDNYGISHPIFHYSIISYDMDLNFIAQDTDGPLAKKYAPKITGADNFNINGLPIIIISEIPEANRVGTQKEFISIDKNSYEPKKDWTYDTGSVNCKFLAGAIGFVRNGFLYLAKETNVYVGPRLSDWYGNKADFGVYDPSTLEKVGDLQFMTPNGGEMPLFVPDKNKILGNTCMYTNGTEMWLMDLDTGKTLENHAGWIGIGTDNKEVFSLFPPYVKSYNNEFYCFFDHTYFDFVPEYGIDDGFFIVKYSDLTFNGWNTSLNWSKELYIDLPVGDTVDIFEHDLKVFYEDENTIWYFTADKYINSSGSVSERNPRIFIWDMRTMSVVKQIPFTDITNNFNWSIITEENDISNLNEGLSIEGANKLISGNKMYIFVRTVEKDIYCSIIDLSQQEVTVKDKYLQEASNLMKSLVIGYYSYDDVARGVFMV